MASDYAGKSFKHFEFYMCFVKEFATSSITVFQFPCSFCLKSFAVGYQKVVLPLSPHRHSGQLFNKTHVGAPRAPARCAITLSQVKIRSQDLMIAAVSSMHFFSSMIFR